MFFVSQKNVFFQTKYMFNLIHIKQLKKSVVCVARIQVLNINAKFQT